MPSSMPAGTSTVMVRRARTRPSVPQVGHGEGICSPVPRAGRAGPGGHDLAEERALHGLDLAGAAAGGAGARRGARGAPVAGAGLAEDRGLDDDLAPRAERRFLEGQRDLQQRVGAGPDRLRRPRPPLIGPPPPKKASNTSPKPPNPPNGLPAAAPPPPPAWLSGSPPRSTMRRFSGSRQHLVGRGDVLEPVLRRRVGVDVRVQLAGQLAVRALELLRRRVLLDAEDSVVVARSVSHDPIRPRSRLALRTTRVPVQCTDRAPVSAPRAASPT